MSALALRCVAEEAPPPPLPYPSSGIEVNDNSDSMAYYCLTQSTGVAFVCRRRQAGRKPGRSLWLLCECETPLLSGERNLTLVDSVGNDTMSILGTAAGPD